jgi:hypothetical protein
MTRTGVAAQGLGNEKRLMMKNEASNQTGGSAAGVSQAAPSLPDVNAETYPYEIVQHLLDQTADFNLFAVPVPHYAESAALLPDAPQDWFGLNGGYGLALRSTLHRFDSQVQAPAPDCGVKTAQAVGEEEGTFNGRLFFGSGDFPWAVGKLPPPVMFDPWRAQRFAIQASEFSFNHEDSFRGYGIGRTFPISVNGCPQLLIGGVGNLREGRGKFQGLEGTFIFTGTLTPELGFLGNITCRIVDPYSVLRKDREIAALTARRDPDPHATFLVLRGVKQDRNVKTIFGPPPGGGLVSLITPSQMRAAQYNFTAHGGGGLHTEMKVGTVVAKMEANVLFNLLAPPGTAEAPVPFTTQELYTFIDNKGRTVGTLTAGVIEGVSFALKFPAAPGQPGVRFAGFGPITGGTGPFAGAQGLLTVNSLIGIAPHVLSLMHMLHLVDTEGRFRA